MNLNLSLELGCCAAPAANGGFSPLDISNLELWLDASDLATLSLRDETYVAGWNDKSGQGNHFTKSVEAEQPTWAANEVDFAASLVHMTAGGNYIFSETDGLSIIGLTKSTSFSALSEYLFDFGLFHTAGYGISYTRNTNRAYVPGFVNGGSFSLNGDYHRIMSVVDFEDNQKLYYDDIEKISAAIPTASLTAANIAENPTQVTGVSGPMTVGKQSATNSISSAFTGKMKQLLIYAKKLTTQEKADIDAYLAGVP